jgi:hypothetical protein
MVDYSIVVPANNIEQVEDAHMTLVHSIATALRSSIRASLKARSKAEANQNELATPLL